MASGGLQRMILVMSQQADLSGAQQLTSKADKTRYVYETLREMADSTQPGIVTALSQMGLTPTARLYIQNAIVVTADGGKAIDSPAVNSLAARADVASIETDDPITADPLEQLAATGNPPSGIAWNVAWVNAPAVWASGFTGKGIVVGDLDTGVQWNHPALINQYRGWNGSSADHNYNWWDPTTEASPVPIDQDGHGTATTGIMVGNDEQGNQIGVAPGASWIACRGLGPGANRSTLLTCLQFMLAPWDLTGANPDPSKAPDIVNNSFVCPFCGFQTAFANLRAAGILPVAVPGNFGPTCGSVFDPGTYPQVLTVGALSYQQNIIAPFSSRGPNTSAPFVVPEIVAPGTTITSSVPTNAYAVGSGTSFAAPAVSGAVALIWSARQYLVGNIGETIQLLQSSATPDLSLSCGSSFQPNNLYGYGTLNVATALGIPTGSSASTASTTQAQTKASLGSATSW
ncbi:MAG TPA: S8 family serine peptidase [Candidatus Binataceae bacterium]|nr:S8 family serine peptidase [Candidatus Binataceae bacterium]